MGKTTYCPKWESEFPWIREVKGSPDKAYCIWCKKTFSIDKCGGSQARSHARSGQHDKSEKLYKNQKTFTSSGSLQAGQFILSQEELIIKAETLNALHYVQHNYSYASASNQSLLYKEMFPDSAIAQSFTCGSSKMAYIIKFGLALYFEEKIKEDIKGAPFTFKFDETTTRQVVKQYDAYIHYWSKTHGHVTTNYLGSLFLGHCTASDLLEHYLQFRENWKLDDNLLLHLGMDGPNVNLLFERNLSEYLKKNCAATFLQLGSCSLHPVHTAFKKGLQEMDFPFDSFFHDLSFFFHLSSARRQDYKSMEKVTEVTAVYVKKHGPTRWLSMKPVGTRVLEQLKNLKEYFLTFLPKQKGFKTSERYERICKVLKRKDIEVFLGFMLFVSTDFEKFLKVFQYDQPMIHVLWVKIAELIRSLMTKFVSNRKMLNEGNPVTDHELLQIDVTLKSTCKKPPLIEVGAKAKCLLSGYLIPDDLEEGFRKKCLKFYKVSTEYLLSHLPHDNKIIEYAQYLHPLKRNSRGSNNGISNTALKITQVSSKLTLFSHKVWFFNTAHYNMNTEGLVLKCSRKRLVMGVSSGEVFPIKVRSSVQ